MRSIQLKWHWIDLKQKKVITLNIIVEILTWQIINKDG